MSLITLSIVILLGKYQIESFTTEITLKRKWRPYCRLHVSLHMETAYAASPCALHLL